MSDKPEQRCSKRTNERGGAAGGQLRTDGLTIFPVKGEGERRDCVAAVAKKVVKADMLSFLLQNGPQSSALIC